MLLMLLTLLMLLASLMDGTRGLMMGVPLLHIHGGPLLSVLAGVAASSKPPQSHLDRLCLEVVLAAHFSSGFS